jgi:hypothetical protein
MQEDTEPSDSISDITLSDHASDPQLRMWREERHVADPEADLDSAMDE